MQHWISAARLRTLPLALSSILMGAFLAKSAGFFSWLIFLLAVLTTVLLQVFSNFANDYGDFKNGADLSGRVGPLRAVQSGAITPPQMLKGIIAVGIAAFVTGIALLMVAFGFNSNYFKIFVVIGLISIWAAYNYTAGSKPYGYYGLGDISVFVFFGLVGVLGSYFLYDQNFDFMNIFPAISCGCLATGVLNLNNIRDIESDKLANKITIPVKIGRQKAILYHKILLGVAALSTLLYAHYQALTYHFYLIAFIFFFINIKKTESLANPDPLLKQLALSTLAFVVLFGLSIIF